VLFSPWRPGRDVSQAGRRLGAAGPLHPISQQLHEKRTAGERLADLIAHHIGSWRFLIIQTILVVIGSAST